MKAILPILLGLAFCATASLAQTPAPPAISAVEAGASTTPGEALVDRIVATLDAHQGITAKIRHRVDLSGRALIGTGAYSQQGRGDGRAFRLDLQLRTTLFATNVQHVCNGQKLWLVEELDGNKRAIWVDMARLRNARPKSRGPGQPPGHDGYLLSLAGLPKLIAGLQDSFRFNTVVENKLDDLLVWSVHGQWEPAKLAQLLPDQKAAIESGRAVDLTPLAANLPHRVVLHVGSDDLFPYRLEYWRSEPTSDNETKHQRLMVVMELYEVQLGAQLDPAQFAYRPDPKVTPIERTKEYLDRFGLEDPPPEEAKRQLRSPL